MLAYDTPPQFNGLDVVDNDADNMDLDSDADGSHDPEVGDEDVEYDLAPSYHHESMVASTSKRPAQDSDDDGEDSGYEDDPVEEAEDDDQDDGSYADEEYGKKKTTRIKRQPSKPKVTRAPSSESDSDSDYGAPSKKKKRKPRMSDEIRISTRGGKVPNYFDDVDDFEEDTHPGYYYADPATQVQQEDEIELVLTHSRDEGREDDPDDNFFDNIRFHIKWKNFSHLHNTDETYEFLKRFKGLKRVDNYIKAYKMYQSRLNTPDLSREDCETLLLDKEREKEEFEMHKTVERVISQREATDGQVEFFCKWNGLNYEHCTWETHDTLRPIAKAEIEVYQKKEAEGKFPFRSTSYTKDRRPQFEKINEDPEYIQETGGELKDFQLTGLNWLAYLWTKGENGILADEMGLGKTVQSVAFLSWLFHEIHQYGPFLVIVPLSTITAWQTQFAAWAPDINVITYIGTAPAREIIRTYEFGDSPKKLKMNVLLTTYELTLRDAKELGDIKWQVLMVDEAHRLKNSESQLYEALLGFWASCKVLITGTPLQNNVKELLSLMHFLMPEKFQLTNEFDLTDDDHEEKIKELHKRLESYMLRRLKRDVLTELPTKSERILRVEMSALQTHWYKNILTKNFQGLVKSANGNNNISLLNIAMELKKAANHPYLFEGVEVRTDTNDETLKGIVMNSGKVVLLDKLMARLRQDGHRVLIFSQMVRMLDILSDYLVLRGYPHQRLDGMVSSDARKKSIAHFNAPGSPDFAFLLSTRAGGLGINLETANTVIIFDSDWNPQNDLQAMARAHRIGQKSHVSVYRFVSKDTMEEDVLERAKKKMVLEYAIINQMDTSQAHLSSKGGASLKDTAKPSDLSKDELHAVLKYGAQRIFDKDDNQQNQKLDDMDLDDILNHAEDHETVAAGGGAGASSGGEGFLSQFAYADIKNDMSWEDIIPLQDRQKLEDEEDKKKADSGNSDLAKDRKRAHPQISYKGMDGDNTGLPPPAKKPKAPAPPRKTANQKAMELKERDVRVLIRSMQRWGDIRQCYDVIVTESKLSNKDKAMITDVADDIVELCAHAVDENNAAKRARVDAGETLTNAQKSRAVLVTYRNVGNINAETVITRHRDLKLLHMLLSVLDDPYKWSIPIENIRPVLNWSGRWGPQEDSMLLVGAYLYGFGNWEAMAKDDKLGLEGKFFLEEGKKGEDASTKPIPNAIHLVRRGDFLLGVLREHDEKLRSFETTLRKKGTTASPAPIASSSAHGLKRRADSEAGQSTEDGSSRKRKRRATPTFTDSESSDECPSMDEGATKEELRPVKKQLKDLKLSGDDMPREKKVAILKDSLGAIGRRIDFVVKQKKAAGEDAEKWKKHLWSFVTLFWPKKVKASKLEEIHAKMVVKEGGAATPEASSSKKARPTKSNGAANGKSSR